MGRRIIPMAASHHCFRVTSVLDGHQHSQGSVCKIPELGENATRCTMPTCWASQFVYNLCGHPSMCENGQGIPKRVGWQKGSMFEELYFIPGKEVGAE